MKVPLLARYNGTVIKAYEFVEKNIVQFPLNLFDIIKKFKWGLITYEEMAKNQQCSIKDICDCLGQDGYSIYNGTNYTIAYNNKKNPKRINFTLAHEIGHIILNHHKDFDVETSLTDNFTKEEYKILENEANCFARNILAPAPLITELSNIGINRTFEISDYFNITFKAATVRNTLLNNDLYYLTETKITKFILKYQRHKICNNCSREHLHISTKYCPLCGNKKLILDGVFTMREYNEISIFEKHECPRCENCELNSDDKYCKICGLPLQNKCSNCGAEMDNSARFCTQCGNKTVFFSSGILSDWHDTNDFKTITTNYYSPLIQNDDDLPF